ncbi:hypothetical protein CH63R_00095 [Colletotrichum higginsianum IMI 349063]|uniref:Uncharacterized protein n=1 Tax=Colletotrichum higginsianum (strain IMI 349063) TaxID=759273 RepID=A0A1B7YS86_COLHI|nr:hypothetical protein CH63R_00095 [Colletotrichum higginsianum IMI 349063]OBR14915.1 hypothetical protein CH63R_00095 [Colletotrichum higginsianum IMI 349063]
MKIPISHWRMGSSPNHRVSERSAATESSDGLASLLATARLFFSALDAVPRARVPLDSLGDTAAQLIPHRSPTAELTLEPQWKRVSEPGLGLDSLQATPRDLAPKETSLDAKLEMFDCR